MLVYGALVDVVECTPAKKKKKIKKRKKKEKKKEQENISFTPLSTHL